MLKCVATFFLLVSPPLFAGSQGYDLNLDLSINGKHVASPKVTVKEGELSTVIQKQNGKKTFIDIVATEISTGNSDSKKMAIRLQFAVGNILTSGQQEVLSRSRLITSENEKSQISSTDKSGKNNVIISVIASRKK